MKSITQKAFPPLTPSERAPLPGGHRRRRSGLPGEFTPMAGSPAETRTRGHLSEARLPLSPLLRMLELFVFYDGRVPGSELSAEGFNIRRLEAEGFIFRTGSHFDFGCYLIGPALERYAALGGCGPGGQKRETEGSEKTALIEPLSIPKAGDIRSAGVATGRRHPYVRGGDSLSSQERLDN